MIAVSDASIGWVLVTGGVGGVGRAVCRLLARTGYSVGINHLAAEASAAQELADELTCNGVGAVTLEGSVAQDADCRSMASTLAGQGPAVGLVNCAGITRHVPHDDLEALGEDDFLRIYRVNLLGAYQMIRACAAPMREAAQRRGVAAAIVNVSSLAGCDGSGSSIAYAASKGALNTMTLSLARSLAPLIRVNAVCPAYINTGWFSAGVGEEADAALREKVSRINPLRTSLEPEDVAETVCYLLASQARAITGEVVKLDAGYKLVIP